MKASEGDSRMSRIRIDIKAAAAAAGCGGELLGDPERPLGRPTPIESAGPGDFAFLDAGKPDEAARGSAAGVIFLARAIEKTSATTQIICADPRGAFFGILREAVAAEQAALEPGIAGTARVHPEARVSTRARIEDFVSIGAGTTIGAGSLLRPGVVVGRDCVIGDGVTLHANVSIREGTVIGDRVTIHDGSSIGADGFGYLPTREGLLKVPQIGIVVIEDDVEIGANVCIDRAALGETRIGRGTKIDNLVQIAHNVVIGPHSVVISQVGISGSTTLGTGVMIGGQAGLVGHLRIGDGAKIGAQSGVGDDLPAGAEVLGSPAYDKRTALRTAMTLPRLPEMRRRLQELERRLSRLEGQSDSGTNSTP